MSAQAAEAHARRMSVLERAFGELDDVQRGYWCGLMLSTLAMEPRVFVRALARVQIARQFVPALEVPAGKRIPQD